jgi:hypothetical protein
MFSYSIPVDTRKTTSKLVAQCDDHILSFPQPEVQKSYNPDFGLGFLMPKLSLRGSQDSFSVNTMSFACQSGPFAETNIGMLV